MLPEDCKNCQKTKTTFFTQIVDGKIKKFDLCADCPHAQAVNDPAGFNLAEQLSAIGIDVTESEVSKGTECPACSFTLTDFRKTGRLGCPECYDVFYNAIEPAIKTMHRGTVHSGKVPQSMRAELELRQKVSELEEALQDAISSEDYESAATLRDDLRELTDQLEKASTE